MTASFMMLLPMIAACFAAMLVPNLLRSAPIYDSLRERTLLLQPNNGSASALSESVDTRPDGSSPFVERPTS